MFWNFFCFKNRKKLALDVAATLLLEKKEDRKKEQRDNSNGAQTDSGFSSKSENIKAERVSENNISNDKTSKQSKTTEQQNSETSSENQDMDVDKPNIRGMYKLLKKVFKFIDFFSSFLHNLQKNSCKKNLKFFGRQLWKNPKNQIFMSAFERSK